MWYGEYTHTLDDKDRFILPAKFREKIKTFRSKKFYITRGLDGCLFLFQQEIWQKMEEKLKSLSFTKQQSRFFNRLYFSGAQEIDVDSQGRISLPEYLREFAKISPKSESGQVGGDACAAKREIVIIGVADRIEVWAKLQWEKFYQENKQKFEEVAENLFE